MINIGIGVGWAKALYSVANNVIANFKARVLSYPNSIFEAGLCLDATLEGLNAIGLLDNASLVITPNAYNEGILYDVIPNTTLGDMDVVRATTATRVNASGLIESVGLNIPRIDYTNGSCPSLLVEPQRTNLALNSDGNLSTYPTAINVTNASSSFNSFVNAIQFPSTGLALAYKSVVTTVQTYAISVFIKMDDNSVPILSASQTTGNMCLIIGGAIATNNLKVESYGNNVYRLSATATSAGTNVNNGVIRYDTQVLKSFKITGIQLEVASYATSYIPTVASTVTRNADIISKSGISSLIGQTEGTLFYDIYLKSRVNYNYISINNGTATNYIGIYITPTNLQLETYVASILQTAIVFTNSNIGRFKIAAGYKNNDFVLYVNGNLIGTDIIGSVPTCNKLDLTSFNQANSIEFYSAQLYKTKLSNTELVQLTTL